MEFINTTLWDNFNYDTSYQMPPSVTDSPNIIVIDEIWQRQKCEMLCLAYYATSKQPSHLMNRSLSEYGPWETTSIGKDGNCLFRCLSHIITGNQESHREVRQLIAHYIASEGLHKIGWYLNQCKHTPCQYFLNEKMTHIDGVWGGDVEIMAASAILEVDIFVANIDFRWGIGGHFHNVTRWFLYRANTFNTAAVYIKNFSEHFEPVESMLNSLTPTFGPDTDYDYIDID